VRSEQKNIRLLVMAFILLIKMGNFPKVITGILKVNFERIFLDSNFFHLVLKIVHDLILASDRFLEDLNKTLRVH
jgi:hypothetical protein